MWVPRSDDLRGLTQKVGSSYMTERQEYLCRLYVLQSITNRPEVGCGREIGIHLVRVRADPGRHCMVCFQT